MSSSGGRKLLIWTFSRGFTRTMCSSSTLKSSMSMSKNLFKSSLTRNSSRLKSSLAETTTTSDSKKGGGSGFEDLDKPIKFTTSKAAEWKATDTHGGGSADDTPAYQPLIVTASVAIFLLYFLALREENDVDERMKVPLWERIPGLERQQLEMLLKYNKDHNLPTTDISERLAYVNKQQADKEKTKTTK